MGRRRSGYIQLDVSELLNEIDDDDLIDELHSRKLTPANPGETVDLDIVREAHNALIRHRPVEAISILERLLFPKWSCPAKAQDAYNLFRGTTLTESGGAN